MEVVRTWYNRNSTDNHIIAVEWLGDTAEHGILPEVIKFVIGRKKGDE